MPGMLNQHPVQLQHSAHPTRHQSHAKTGGLVPEGAARTGELLQEQQNPAATPKNGSLLAAEPLLAERQQLAAAAALLAAPTTAGAA